MLRFRRLLGPDIHRLRQQPHARPALRVARRRTQWSRGSGVVRPWLRPRELFLLFNGPDREAEPGLDGCGWDLLSHERRESVTLAPFCFTALTSLSTASLSDVTALTSCVLRVSTLRNDKRHLATPRYLSHAIRGSRGGYGRLGSPAFCRGGGSECTLAQRQAARCAGFDLVASG